MRTDTWIQSNALNDSLCVQTLHLSVSIQLVEVRHTQSQIGICKQLHRLSLLQSHEQRVYVLLDSALLQQLRECLSRLLHVVALNGLNSLVLLIELSILNHLREANNDSTWPQVILQCLALTQELRREQQTELPALAISHRSHLGKLLGVLHVQRTAIANRYR